MPYLDKIVNSINDVIINTSLRGIPPAKIKAYGIVETMLEARENDKGETVTIRYPGLIDNDGEVNMIDIDDGYYVILYHKVESMLNGIAAKSAYGDSVGNLLETANMSMVVFAFRNTARKPAWWFEAAIKDQVREKMKLNSNEGVLLQSSNIRIGNSSFDKLSLLQREYSEIELNYPNLIAIEIKYRIESSWKKGCFSSCCGNRSANYNYIATEISTPILTEQGNVMIPEN